MVEDDTTLYTMVNEKIDSHITEIRRAFRHSVPFLEILEGTVSVDVRIILLVEDDTTLYIMVTNMSTKR